jgi:hypothetical protein
MGEDFKNINKVIYEADYDDLCDYKKLALHFVKEGFKLVDNADDFRYVYLR